MNQNHIGKVRVSMDFIRKDPDAALKVFQAAGLLVVDAVIEYAGPTVVYTCLCEMFDETSPEMYPPFYMIEIETHFPNGPTEPGEIKAVRMIKEDNNQTFPFVLNGYQELLDMEKSE